MSKARNMASFKRSDGTLDDNIYSRKASPSFSGTPTGISASHITTGVLPVGVTGGSGLTALGIIGSGTLSSGVTGGSGLNALSASNLSAGTVPDARFPSTLPAASGANLTALPAANITGELPVGVTGGSGLNALSTTKSDVGLGSVENTALSTWSGSTNLVTIGRLTSEIKTANHVYGTDWYNHGSGGGSDIYLRTPIVHNESNMFNIEVLSYEYGGSYAGSYMFGAYAYGGSTMISVRTTTIHGRSISMGVTNNKIWCRINGGAGYYNHYCFRYHGWQAKDNSGFSWGNSA